MTKRRIDVLLVEDDPVAAGLLHAQLTSDFSTRFELTRAASLEDAVSLVRGESFDVAVLDLVLPDARGFEGLDRLRTEVPHLPVVVITGLDDEEVAAAALRRGAQDYLVKGELTARLVTRSLRYAIERQQLRKALHELALLDDATGLFNSRGFDALAENQMKAAARMRRGLALIAIRAVSPAVGALDLRAVADTLRANCRGSDLLAYFGDDRFVVLTIAPSRDAAHGALARLQAALEESARGTTLELDWLETPASRADLLALAHGPRPATA